METVRRPTSSEIPEPTEPNPAGPEPATGKSYTSSRVRLGRTGLWSVLNQFAIIIAFAALAVLLHRAEIFRPIEKYVGFDRFFERKRPIRSHHTSIVEIGDDEFSKFFGDTLPLPSQSLTKIIAAVQRSHPAIIGVALTTKLDPTDPLTAVDGVAWALPLRVEQNELATTATMLGEPPDSTKVLSGISAFPVDADGIIRRYRRTFKFPVVRTASSETILLKDSFHWVIAKQFCRARLTEPGCTAVNALDREEGQDLVRDIQALEINRLLDKFSFDTVSASDLLGANTLDVSERLRDRVVLIGGTFHAARDLYRRPGEVIPGSEFIATAIESELSGGGIHEVSEPVLFGLECAVGLITLLILKSTTGRLHAAILILAPVVIVAASLFFSFLAFSRFALWVNFVPASAGVTLHHLSDIGREGVSEVRDILIKALSRLLSTRGTMPR